MAGIGASIPPNLQGLVQQQVEQYHRKLYEIIQRQEARIKSLESAVPGSAVDSTPAGTPPKKGTTIGGGVTNPPPVVGGLAPNLTNSVTGDDTDIQGTHPVWRPSGKVFLPVNDPDFANLDSVFIRVEVESSGSFIEAIGIDSIQKQFISAEHSMPFVGAWLPRAAINTTYKLTFICRNAAGEQTPNPITELITVTGAPAQVGSPGGISLVSATGADNLGRYVDDSQLTHTNIACTGKVQTSNGDTPGFYNVTFWLSGDNGANWIWIGWYGFTAVTTFLQVIDSLVPGPGSFQWTTTTWKVAMFLGAANGVGGTKIPTSSLPEGRVISATFTVNYVSIPANNGVTNVHVGTVQSQGYNSAGVPYYDIILGGGVGSGPPYGISFTMNADPNVWYAVITIQYYKSNGVTPAADYQGVEREVQEFIGIGDHAATIHGWTWDVDTDAVLARFRIYLVNRNVSGGFADAAHSQRQNIGGGGADHIDLNIGVQRAALNINQMNPAATDGTITTILDQNGTSTDTIGANNKNLAVSSIWDFSFDNSYNGGAAPTIFSNWKYTQTNGSSVTIRNDGGYSGKMYARLTSGGTNVTPTLYQNLISIAQNVPLYVACALRSSNTGGAHTITVQVDFLDKNAGFISAVTQAASGFIANWTFPLLGQTLIPPANASYIDITFYTNTLNGGYWDVDYVLLQQVINQQNGSQPTTMNPSTGGGGAALVTSSVNDSSQTFVGKAFTNWTSPDGLSSVIASAFTNGQPTIVATVGGAQFFAGVIGGVSFMQVTDNAGHGFKATGTGAVLANGTAGFTGAVAGRSCINGIVV